MTWAKTAATLALGVVVGAAANGTKTDGDADVVMLNVYFTLNDPSRENIDKCINACKKYASKQEGSILFACGERAEGDTQPFRDKDFHVAQTLLFRSRKALDKYKNSEERQRFVAEGRSLWSKVRVFEVNLRGLETPGLKRADSATEK